MHLAIVMKVLSRLMGSRSQLARKTLIEDLIQYVCNQVEIQEIQARHCLPTDFLDNSYGPVHKQPSFCRSGGDTRSVESTTRRRPRAPETGSTLGIRGRWVSLRGPSSKVGD